LKKIVHLTSVHPPYDIRIFYKECKTLSKAGYKVVLIVPHDRNEFIDGVTIRGITKSRNRFERMTYTAWKIFRAALKEKAELYHFHDPELLPWAKLLQVFGKRVIFDMHENYSKAILTKDWIKPIIRRMIASLYKTLEYFFLRKTPVIYAERSYAKDYHWIKKHYTVLNMPIIDDLFCLHEPKYPLHTVGYMGAVTRARGSLMTLRALQILKDQGYTVHWECIGRMNKDHRADLIRFSNQYHLKGINIRGYLLPIDGWRILSRCHIGLAVLQPIPNYIESYPTKMFEYMALGLPVVVSDFPLYREIVEHYQCGLYVNPQKPEEIAQAIHWLIEHPEEAKEMGLRGIKAVASDFNWDTEAKKLLNSYETLLSSIKK
jgi:glycosyltransferase involved in cell wall biosynthesis